MKDKQKLLVVRIDAELHYQIKMAALKEKISIQQWVERLLTERMDKDAQ